MKKKLIFILFKVVLLFITSCAGMKIINPNEQNKNKGTLALDLSEGTPKLVSTFTCELNSMGNHFSAVSKTEDDARKEVVAKCQDRTVLSFCKPENIKCIKN